MAELSPVNIPKITIIFPPGDQIASLLLAKENGTKIEDLIVRLCTLRAIEFESKKFAVLNDLGEEVDLTKTVGESAGVFLEILDRKDIKKEKKKSKKENFVNKGLPNGLKQKVGECCYVPLEEQLFDDEKKVQKEFKEKNAELTSNYSDEFVMACLFVRKFDFARTLELLQTNLQWRKDNGFMKIPKFSDFDHGVFEFDSRVVGSRDKCGRNIRYLNASRTTPNILPFTVDNVKKFVTWFNFVGQFAEGIDTFRNGTHIICYFPQAYSWKNFDLEYQKQLSTVWTCFPNASRRMSFVEPPLIINAVMKIVNTFVKSKIMNRVHHCKKGQKSLLKWVDKSSLSAALGGDVPISFEKEIALFAEWAEKNEVRLSVGG